VEMNCQQKAAMAKLCNSKCLDTFLGTTAQQEMQGLEFEMRAVDALSAQLGVISYQIGQLEQKVRDAGKTELQRELASLRLVHEEVLAEKKAAALALEAACKDMAMAEKPGNQTGHVTVSVCVDASRPSQSLRGQDAERHIKRALENSGPWAHYAAHQFQAMLRREQDLHADYVCFYHSYSFAALLYELNAEIARTLFGLAVDFPPLPRLSRVACKKCNSKGGLQRLRQLGGEDHDPEFRGVGLSASCSLFAFSSEAPPLNCFQQGYSCMDLSFRGLLIATLTECFGETSTTAVLENIAEMLIDVAQRHRLPTSGYRYEGDDSAYGQGTCHLTGYMLQMFIHRSSIEDFAYPSEPYGVPIHCDMQEYVSQGATADGQARVYFDPQVFMDPCRARLYHYCARPLQSCMDANVPASRGAFINDLRATLQPLFLGSSISGISDRLEFDS